VRDHSRWHATAAVVLAVLLYELLPPRFTVGPLWVAPIAVLVFLVPLVIMRVRGGHSTTQRAASIVLIAIVNFFNIVSIVLLITDILTKVRQLTGAELLVAGAQIWLTNVIVFALWYWELDGGGPFPRALQISARDVPAADFLFPQMNVEAERMACMASDWKPQFLDYLYLSFTNATAFSPTDVMPLSTMAKMLMLVESLMSHVTLALVLARSVNILA
jgi:uncharacterized membrane protein